MTLVQPDVISTIESKMLTAMATAIGGAVFSNLHDKSSDKPYANLEVTEQQPEFVDANMWMERYANAQFFFSGDSKDQVRACISAAMVLFEPLPTDWTGVQLIDIKPGAPDQPSEDTSVKALFIGGINYEVTFRVSYV